MNVRDFYSKDCLDKSDPICACTPNIHERKECSFVKEELILEFEEKLKVLSQYGFSTENKEAMDYIKEFPIFILKAGKVLCHSTKPEEILQ